MRRAALLLLALTAVTLLVRQVVADTDAAPSSATAAARETARTLGPVPLVKQIFRNNCETAALSMMLAAAGKRIDQRVLQRQLGRSGPLDPIVADDGTWTWGDPDMGFVGRAPGGGTAGGFGAYPGPIRRLAARHDVRLDDLSQTNVETIVSRLQAGRPVMAWIGLSEGPYRRWRTPSGKEIVVNFGEHTVVLTAVRGATILVNDPLSGSKLEWSISEFTKRWRLLGKRALAL